MREVVVMSCLLLYWMNGGGPHPLFFVGVVFFLRPLRAVDIEAAASTPPTARAKVFVEI